MLNAQNRVEHIQTIYVNILCEIVSSPSPQRQPEIGSRQDAHSISPFLLVDTSGISDTMHLRSFKYNTNIRHVVCFTRLGVYTSIFRHFCEFTKMLDPDEAVQQLRGSSSMGVRVPSRVLNVAKNVAMLSNQDGVKHIPNCGQVISPYVSYCDMLRPHLI